MALPFWLPFALMGASTLVNSMAAQRQQSAIASVMEAERQRQQEFSDQQFGIFEGMTDRFGEYDAREGERRTNLEDFFTADTEGSLPQPVQTALPESSSNLVTSREESERADARGFTDQQAGALAQMRSFGDVFGDFGRENQRDMGETGIIQSFRRGSQSVLPAELRAAEQKGAGMRTLGDMLSLGTSLTMSMPGGGGLTRIFG